MKLIIDIPEKTVNEIKDNAMFAGTIPSEILWDVTSAIVNGIPLKDEVMIATLMSLVTDKDYKPNGTPLDKIKAEVEALNEKVSVDYKMCLDKSAVLQIIDKYREGESE